MATDYPGNPVYPITITVPDDGDLDPAASVAVAMEQLADRTAYLNTLITGGIGLDFTNATFHGTTTFADGSIVATITTASLTTTGAITLSPTGGLTVNAASSLNSDVTITGSLFVSETVTIDVNLGVGGIAYLNEVSLMGILTPSGFGRVKKRTATLDSSRTIAIGEADIFVVPLLSADIICPLSNTDAEEGDTLRVNAWLNTSINLCQINYGSHAWQLRNETVTAPIRMVWIEFLFTGGAWIVNDSAVANAQFNT